MTRSITIDDLTRIVIPTETTISPDGTQVVFVRSETIGGTASRSLWSASVGSSPRRLTNGPAESAPRFSPDGTAIAFLRDVDGAPQLHVLPLDGGDPRRLTDPSMLPLGAGAAVWSPDGTRIAAAVPIRRSTGDRTPLVTDRLGYKADGAGWLGETRMHLIVVRVADGATTRLTDGDWNTGEPSWSSDGTELAFTSDLEPGSDLTLSSRAYRIVVDDPIIPPAPLGSAASVGGSLLRLADDTVVAVGGAATRPGNANLIALGTTPGETDTVLTAALDRNVMVGGPGYPGGRPALTDRGDEIVFCLRERGWTHLHAIGVDGGTARAIIANENEVVSALSVATAARAAAVVLTSQTSFGEVAIVDLDTGAVTVLTSLTADALADVELLAAAQREFTISDGGTVHGWLLAAPGLTGAAPLLLDVHGGPHNAWSGVADAAHLYHQVLAAQGWRILTLNPRGSDGYGEEFMRAVVGGWGTADVADFHDPLDALIAEGLANPDRLAVAGYSYGGYTVCQLTSRSDRFAAAVAGGLICDFGGMAGDSDVGVFLADISVGVSPVEGIERLIAASPIAAVSQVKTPTLILHGADDQRCPVSQAEQWFSALRVQDVPSRLVVYPDASHVFILNGALDQRVDYNRRVIEWLQRYTAPVEGRKGSTSLAARGTAAWQAELDALRGRYGVTGAQFGIVELDADGRTVSRTTVGSGVLNASTGAPVDVDAIFQIGSITKVFTTMLIMQLVDEGLLGIDDTVRSALPDFALDDEDTAAAVTVRSLLSHRSGIDGDLFTDTGRGDDCVERYVASLATAKQVHALDEGFSYCNSGFVVAGRIVEVLRGTTWDVAVKERILTPLGLSHTVTIDADVPRFAAATGHTEDSVPVPVWSLPRSVGPAGRITASIGDLLTFGELGLRKGVAADGTRIVSESAALQMRERQIDLTDITPSLSGWGLGWFLEEWSEAPVFGHDGGTYGQRAYLRIFPEQGFALALLTSGGKADGLYQDLFTSAARSIAGLSAPEGLFPADRGDDPVDAILGSYGSGGIGVEIVSTEDGCLECSVSGRGASAPSLAAEDEEPERETLTIFPSSRPGTWVGRGPGSAGWTQFRPHRDGAYFGFRFLPREFPEEETS